MKYKIIIDDQQVDDIKIYVKEKNEIVEKIEQLLLENNFEIIGYVEREAVKLNLRDISCFISENNKIFALTDDKKYQIKYKLYQLNEQLPDSFLKINQSCIANTDKISRFVATIYGALKIEFKNGYSDYVSRRNIKYIKERLGL